jgi:hypothetical protein
MTTALLVIDVQGSFRARDSWSTVSAPDIADRIHPLVEAARTAGHHVIWVLHTEPGTGDDFDPAGGHVRLIEGLKPLDDEPVLHKTSHNAFTTTNLGQYLTALTLAAAATPVTLPLSKIVRRDPDQAGRCTWGVEDLGRQLLILSTPPRGEVKTSSSKPLSCRLVGEH